VIAFYTAGEREAGAKLHRKVRKHFFKILELCETYKDVHKDRINHISVESHIQAKRLRLIAGTAMWTAIFLGALLAIVLVTQILNPLRTLASAGDNAKVAIRSGDEVKAVGHRVQSLMKDVDLTRVQLKQSQAHLLQSEKLALVGKLAAGVAHSIRNPLTSVKMRLFSMGRTLDMSETHKEDFEVISEEIRHVDNIVQNFLEFSRPPKLKMQKVNPSDVVDMALQLLRHRLESYGADVRLNRRHRLPEILVDPEQLKEVLVNLVVNACEAMGGGGQIVITEREGVVQPLGRVVVIQVSDSGPGVPEGMQEQLFEPFFSTKEEGSGLGLSIAARIVEEHGGWVNVTSREGKGATFSITLPCKEGQRWVRS
jgi:signal transduction histidine kinase